MNREEIRIGKTGRGAMPTLTRSEAVERLTQVVRDMSLDDLLDFHGELFPEEPKLKPDEQPEIGVIRRRVLDYLGRGIEVEEILDLWNVAFPEAWNVTYDDEFDEIQYSVEPDAVRQAD
jgi:hypothetical protein